MRRFHTGSMRHLAFLMVLGLVWAVWKPSPALKLVASDELASEVGKLLGPVGRNSQGIDIPADQCGVHALVGLAKFHLRARDLCLENLLNVDNCNLNKEAPYRRRSAQLLAGGQMRVVEEPADFKWVYDPGHPLAITEGAHRGYLPLPNVNADLERLTLARHQRRYLDYLRALRKLEALRPDLVVMTPGSDQGPRLVMECRDRFRRCCDLYRENLENEDTCGYRRQSFHFEAAGEGFIQHSLTHLGQAALRPTVNPLFLALDDNGRHFFTIQTPDGREYTRDGRFHLSTSGHVVTADGSFLLGRRGPIKLRYSWVVDDRGRFGEDRLLLSRCQDQKQLVRTGLCTFRGQLEEAADARDYRVLQGFLEDSNVNPQLERVALQQAESVLEVVKEIDLAEDHWWHNEG